MARVKKPSPKVEKRIKSMKKKSKATFSKVNKTSNKKSEKITPAIKEEKEILLALSKKVDYEQIYNAIEAMLQYDERRPSVQLFQEEKPIYVQIQSIKIPVGPNLRLRFPVKHPLVTDKSEVCLIVADLETGRNVDHEPTIEHYQELLKAENVTCIKRILPFRQLKVEYNTFEMRRRLFAFFDYFLVDGKIAGHVSHFLGQKFYKSSKMPIPIHMTNGSLKENINYGLSKVLLNLRFIGDSYMVACAHNKMLPTMILENIERIIKCLAMFFPGGFDNIRCLSLAMENSISIPFYLTLKPSNSVPVPIIEERKPKSCKPVRGELSTALHRDVIVYPTGEVEVIPAGKQVPLEEPKPVLEGNAQLSKFPVVKKEQVLMSDVRKKKKNSKK